MAYPFNNFEGPTCLIRELPTRSIDLLMSCCYVNLIAYVEIRFPAMLVGLDLLLLLRIRGLLLGLLLDFLYLIRVVACVPLLIV